MRCIFHVCRFIIKPIIGLRSLLLHANTTHCVHVNISCMHLLVCAWLYVLYVCIQHVYYVHACRKAVMIKKLRVKISENVAIPFFAVSQLDFLIWVHWVPRIDDPIALGWPRYVVLFNPYRLIRWYVGSHGTEFYIKNQIKIQSQSYMFQNKSLSWSKILYSSPRHDNNHHVVTDAAFICQCHCHCPSYVSIEYHSMVA